MAPAIPCFHYQNFLPAYASCRYVPYFAQRKPILLCPTPGSRERLRPLHRSDFAQRRILTFPMPAANRACGQIFAAILGDEIAVPEALRSGDSMLCPSANRLWAGLT